MVGASVIAISGMGELGVGGMSSSTSLDDVSLKLKEGWSGIPDGGPSSTIHNLLYSSTQAQW